MGETEGTGGDLAVTREAEEEGEVTEDGDDGGRGGREVDVSGDDGARPSIMSLRFCLNVRNRASGDGMPCSRGVALAM